jgi:rSAM-associated Gly-rich repeat protein
MSTLNRRQCFTTFFNGLLGAAGSVVLASVALARSAAGANAGPREEDGKDLEQRADRLGCVQAPPSGDKDLQLAAWVNGGFRKGGWVNGGFANGGFRNGGFRNGGWRNGY